MCTISHIPLTTTTTSTTNRTTAATTTSEHSKRLVGAVMVKVVVQDTQKPDANGNHRSNAPHFYLHLHHTGTVTVILWLISDR